jgi:hypothetical protein
MLWQAKKYSFAYLQKFNVRKDSFGLQIANPQYTNQQITKKWVHKLHICKVPYLQKLGKSNKLFKSAKLQFAELICRQPTFARTY